MTDSLVVDAQKVRREAVDLAQRELERARTTSEKHYARLALQKAQRAVGGQHG